MLEKLAKNLHQQIQTVFQGLNQIKSSLSILGYSKVLGNAAGLIPGIEKFATKLSFVDTEELLDDPPPKSIAPLFPAPTEEQIYRDWKNFSFNLKSLHRLHTTSYNSFDQLFTDYLQTGREIFDLETGIISKIIDNTYIIDSVNSNLESLQPKLEFPLENTYCKEVVKTAKTITYTNVGKMETMKGHPVYQNLKLESYIGTPILINGKVYGTLNFSSTKIRAKGFTTQEQEIAELMAQSISKYIVISQKETSLQESEARFRTTADSAPIMIWISDVSAKCTFFNTAWLEFTGISLDRSLGYGWTNQVHPEDLDFCLNTYLTAFKNRQPFEMEYRLKKKDGEYGWILEKGRPRFTSEGEFLGYIGSCIDISDRRKTLESIEKQHRRSQLFQKVATKIRKCLKLAEILATAVKETKQLLEADRVLIIRLFDESAIIVKETECISCKKLKGEEIVNPLADSEYLEKYRQGEIIAICDLQHEIELLDLQKQPYHFGVKATLIVPIFTKEKLWGLLAIHQCYDTRQWEKFEIQLSQELADRIGDAMSFAELLANLENLVSQRTEKLSQANQQLQQQIEDRTRAEKQLRIITDNIPAFVSYVDSDLRYRFNNKVYQDWFNKPLSEITGKKIQEIIPDQYYPKIQKPIERVLSGEKVREDNQIIDNNGSLHWVNINYIPDFDRHNRVKGFFALIIDITERKAIEAMKNDFLSIVSHELRTPLASIHGSIKLLATGKLGQLSPKGLQMITIADNNADRLVRLVGDILDLQHMESGKVKLEKRSCTSSSLIHQAIDLIAPIAAPDRITLVSNSANISFWADPDYILQVLTNLISNGIKFSQVGATIWIAVELIEEKSCVLFSVKDTGKGIPQDKLKTIFGRFQQVDASDSREKGGTGLGLAICRIIVEFHGGKIWAESVLGQGSTFYFTLPLSQ